MREKKLVTVELVECPYGHGGEALVINGTRVTGSKCCGSWATVKEYKVAASDVTAALSAEP